MKKAWQHIVLDERAAILSIEMILVATIVVIGLIVGVSSLRDSIVQEMGDAAAGVAALDHSYEFNELVISTQMDTVHSSFYLPGSFYLDAPNAGEPAILDPSGGPPICIDIDAGLIENESF